MSSLQFIMKLWQMKLRFLYLAKIGDYNFLKVVSLSKSVVLTVFLISATRLYTMQYPIRDNYKLSNR